MRIESLLLTYLACFGITTASLLSTAVDSEKRPEPRFLVDCFWLTSDGKIHINVDCEESKEGSDIKNKYAKWLSSTMGDLLLDGNTCADLEFEKAAQECREAIKEKLKEKFDLKLATVKEQHALDEIARIFFKYFKYLPHVKEQSSEEYQNKVQKAGLFMFDEIFSLEADQKSGQDHTNEPQNDGTGMGQSSDNGFIKATPNQELTSGTASIDGNGESSKVKAQSPNEQQQQLPLTSNNSSQGQSTDSVSTLNAPMGNKTPPKDEPPIKPSETNKDLAGNQDSGNADIPRDFDEELEEGEEAVNNKIIKALHNKSEDKPKPQILDAGLSPEKAQTPQPGESPQADIGAQKMPPQPAINAAKEKAAAPETNPQPQNDGKEKTVKSVYISSPAAGLFLIILSLILP